MLSPCLAAETLRAFLADELPPEAERELADHVDACTECQALLEQLSEDEPTRRLLAEHRHRQGAHAARTPLPQLEEVRERLHVLGWFTSAPPGDGGSTFAAGNGSGSCTAAVAEAAVTCVGKFQIVQPIGAGGFGVVYLARDTVLHRQVALKLARSNVLADPDLKSRFLREAEALARLAHPHIIPVYEAGEHDGTCYLAVGYCDGPTLEQWLRDRGTVAPRLAAELTLALAQAVEHAHQHGILHRDIKPSNILLDKTDPQSGQEFAPQLTDFGLAKIAEQETQTTLCGTLLGTPQYMAPEQAAGMVERIGPATDVYALGAVLYEMLTGRPPIRGASSVDTLRRVLIDEPAPPRSLAAVPDDLDAIVLKCLDKSPPRRYASAGDLAADLERFLEGRPTVARPLTARQRAVRWVRRNPAASIVTGLLAVVVLLAAGMFVFNRQLADLQRQMARQSAQQTYRDDILTAAARFADGDVASAQQLLKAHLPAAGQEDVRGLEWHYLWSQVTHDAFAEYNAGSAVYHARLSPDGQRLAVACEDGWLRILSARTLQERLVLKSEQRELNSVAWSSDGRLVAGAFDSGTVRIWNLADLGPPREIRAGDGKLYAAAFFDDDTKLLTGGDDALVRVWDLASGRQIAALAGHTRAVEALAISPTDSLLATAGSDRQVLLWNLDTLKQVGELPGHTARLTSVAFSPDGRLLATGDLDCAVCLWDVTSQSRVGRGFSLDSVQSLAFASGERLVVGDRGGAIRNFRLAAQTPPQAGFELRLDSADDAWRAHDGRVYTLAALPGGERFVSGGQSGTLRAWGRGQDSLRRWSAAPDRFQACGYSRDAAQLFALRVQGGVELYDPENLKPLGSLALPPHQWGSLAVLAGRAQVAAGSATGDVAVWNWKSRNLVHHWQVAEGEHIDHLSYSPAAHLLAVVAYTREDVLLVDPDTGERVAALPAASGTSTAFSPDGRRLVVDTLNKLAIYDLALRRLIGEAAGHRDTVAAIAYSPDGRLLASASSDRTLRLWTADGEPLATLHGHVAPLTAVAFAPSGRSLISGDAEGRIKVYHVASQRELLEIPSGLSGVRGLAISADSQRLVVVGQEGDMAVIGPGPRRGQE